MTHIFAFEGHSGHPDDWPKFSHHFAKDWHDCWIRPNFTSFTWNYYSQRMAGIHAAMRRALSSDSRPIMVLGFSNGGHAAIIFAKWMVVRDFDVRLAVTCDPVKKLRYVAQPDQLVYQRVVGVRRWVNHYQRSDRFSLAHSFPLRGHPIQDADVNKEWKSLGDYGHVLLPQIFEFSKAMLDELAGAGVERQNPGAADWIDGCAHSASEDRGPIW